MSFELPGSPDFLVLVTGVFSTLVIFLIGASFKIIPFLFAYIFMVSLLSK